MNELVHMALEGLFAVLLGVAGFFLKSLWNEIREVRKANDEEVESLRDKLDKNKEALAALELRVEKEFVKHSGLDWIKEKLDKFEKILSEIQLSMARHRRDDPGAGE